MFIVKLGGSVITDKSKENCFKHEIFDKLSEKIKRANKKTIIIHGAGSFGHIIAKKFNLNQGFKNKEQLHGFSLTHAKVQKLNSLVLDSFLKNGISAVSMPPHSVLKLKNHKPSKFDYLIFKDYLDMDFFPVTFGDVVLDEKLNIVKYNASSDLFFRFSLLKAQNISILNYIQSGNTANFFDLMDRQNDFKETGKDLIDKKEKPIGILMR